MKVAIMYNEKYGWYESYRYNFPFRLFGASNCFSVACAITEEELLKLTKQRLKGKLIFVRIAEI